MGCLFCLAALATHTTPAPNVSLNSPHEDGDGIFHGRSRLAIYISPTTCLGQRLPSQLLLFAESSTYLEHPTSHIPCPTHHVVHSISFITCYASHDRSKEVCKYVCKYEILSWVFPSGELFGKLARKRDDEKAKSQCTYGKLHNAEAYGTVHMIGGLVVLRPVSVRDLAEGELHPKDPLPIPGKKKSASASCSGHF